MKRAALLLLACAGCTSVGVTASPAPGIRLPPRAGNVAVYASHAPEHAIDLGEVEVHADPDEGTVEQLFPLFVQRVAAMGGDAAVIDSVKARFDVVPRPYFDTFTYRCGFQTCLGQQTTVSAVEVTTLVMRGHAMRLVPPGGAR